MAALPGEKNRLERCERDFEPKSGLETRFCLTTGNHRAKAVPRLNLFFPPSRLSETYANNFIYQRQLM